MLNAAGNTELAKSAVGYERGFTGYILDGETGLYYARARMYSAGLGRFVSRDPLGYVDGMSFYAAYFVPNLVDPTGTYGEGCCRPGFSGPTRGGYCCNGTFIPAKDLVTGCCNGQVYNKVTQCCTSSGVENKTVSRWVCRRPLNTPFWRHIFIGPISHSFYFCSDPSGQSPLPPALGKQPRPLGLPGSAFYGPGYLALEDPVLIAPYVGDCKELKFCPSEAPPCQEGPTQSPYWLFPIPFCPDTNCHGFAHGQSR